MSSESLANLAGAALGLYVVHEVLHNGKLGRRIGAVRARSEKHALHILSKHKHLPGHVRVFKGKVVSKKKKHNSHKQSSGIGFNTNVKMPRLF